MSKALRVAVTVALVFSQLAGLHYHVHGHESADAAMHEHEHSWHPAAAVHTDGELHDVFIEVEAFAIVTLQGAQNLDVPILAAAVLLLTWISWSGPGPAWPWPRWKPKPASTRLRPPLRAPPR
jgi:hypothetical protein